MFKTTPKDYNFTSKVSLWILYVIEQNRSYLECFKIKTAIKNPNRKGILKGKPWSKMLILFLVVAIEL